MLKSIRFNKQQINSIIAENKKSKSKRVLTETVDDLNRIDVIVYNKSDMGDGEYEYDITCYDLDAEICYDEYGLTYQEVENAFGKENALKIRNSKQLNGRIYNDLSTTIINHDDIDEVLDVASRYFSITDYSPGKTGYLLPNGSFLEVGTNGHIAICCLDGMTVGKFISLGNIRVDTDIFELEKPPTFEQKKQLYRLIGSGDYIYVDICKYEGGQYSRIICSGKYHVSNPKIVLNQIDRYFDEGIKLKFIDESKDKKGKLLTERTSSVIYHWCSPQTAWKILQTNRFSLMSTLFKGAEANLLGASHKHMYYMSMTRNGKIGMGGYSNVEHPWVRLTLDGDMLNTNYHIKALDYWGKSMGKHSRMNGSRSTSRKYVPKDGSETETEDRLYSRKPFIDNALNYIKHIDIFLDYTKEKANPINIQSVYNICLNASSISTLYSSVKDFNQRRNQVDLRQFYDYVRDLKNNSYYSVGHIKDGRVDASFFAACAYLVNFPYCSLEDCMRTIKQYGLEKYAKQIVAEFRQHRSTFLFDMDRWDERDIERVLKGWVGNGLFDYIQLANNAQGMDREDLARGYQILTDFCSKHKLSNFKDIEAYFKKLVNNNGESQLEMKSYNHLVELTCVYVENDSKHQFVSIEPEVDKYKEVFYNGDRNLQYLFDDIEQNVDSIQHKSQDNRRFLSYIKRLLINPTVKEVYDLCNKLQELGYENIDNDYYKPVFATHDFNYEEIRWNVLSDWGFQKDDVVIALKDKSQKEKIIEKWNNS